MLFSDKENDEEVNGDDEDDDESCPGREQVVSQGVLTLIVASLNQITIPS